MGFAVGPHRIPIVPAAILFDLINGGDKDWGRYPPYRELGYQAAAAASRDFCHRHRRRGRRRIDGHLQGRPRIGLVRWSRGEHMIGALVAANPMGSVTIGDTRHFLGSTLRDRRRVRRSRHACALPQRCERTQDQVPRDGARRIQHHHRPSSPPTPFLTKAEAKRLAIWPPMPASRGRFWPSHTAVRRGTWCLRWPPAHPPADPRPKRFLDLCAAAASDHESRHRPQRPCGFTRSARPDAGLDRASRLNRLPVARPARQ